MFDFNGKTAIVTGGTRGIGLETSRLFAKFGANVVASYRSNDKAAQKLKDEFSNIEVFKGDISEVETAKSLVSFAYSKFGRVDILVNNAGIWDYLYAGSFDYKVWDNMIKNNLRSVYLVTDYLVSKWLKDETKGRIVHVSSTAGQRGEAEHSHYAATKGAIIAYTKSLSSELAPKGIITNCVAPGWVDTELNEKPFAGDGKEKIRKTIPIGRIPEPVEIAWPIVFLASDLASAVCGEIFNVNGGSVLCG
ncbi:3-oxoacyl-[acyl-carrier protein] reductase [Thermotomaculum hydrothermale]|uniref:3-oxoacyl-[acyl-carrier protein] reductase n=1 Tax=Thermotomaculum hydrothermale TaxID=981385 RepID=A0A7R6SXH1_9BACT|nr:SDR family oxidoreductase [Thermotomaculum hydrothermale]BBB31784.1 3-oxoacyl-[acyl-carrier protein] reductase [Thermotomaculum hydrothermale]